MRKPARASRSRIDPAASSTTVPGRVTFVSGASSGAKRAYAVTDVRTSASAIVLARSLFFTRSRFARARAGVIRRTVAKYYARAKRYRILGNVDSLRDQALAPLSRADAERLLPQLASGRQTLERRILRARALKYMESFDLAWAELNEVLPLVKEPLLEARVAVDLLQLSYYLVRRDETPRLAQIAQKHAAGDPLMLAEFHLGNSTVLTAQNEITSALQSARRAEDALLTAPKGRSRDLVVTRVQRQIAHLLSHSGAYDVD